jgi:hypothetical protein
MDIVGGIKLAGGLTHDQGERNAAPSTKDHAGLAAR